MKFIAKFKNNNNANFMKYLIALHRNKFVLLKIKINKLVMLQFKHFGDIIFKINISLGLKNLTT